jgi:hypothetical protein
MITTTVERDTDRCRLSNWNLDMKKFLWMAVIYVYSYGNYYHSPYPGFYNTYYPAYYSPYYAPYHYQHWSQPCFFQTITPMPDWRNP